MDGDPAQGVRGGRVEALDQTAIPDRHQALAKVLANPEPPGYQMSEIRRKSVIGPHLATIDQILADDKEAPPKQRHTARRIFERLRDEHGYTGCYSQVQTAVQRTKQYSKEAFVPLSHPPGHSQFDFGEAVVEIAGERRKAALGVITLPYSDTYFLSAYPRECTETFQAAHVAGFEFFGGVPVRISYDNALHTAISVLTAWPDRVHSASTKGDTRRYRDPRDPPRVRDVGRASMKGDTRRYRDSFRSSPFGSLATPQ